MIGILVGMVICLVIILVATDMWLGEMLGAAAESDTPSPLAKVAILVTGVAAAFYILLSFALFN